MFHPLFSKLGKDRIIFVTKEDHETPSNAELVADDPNDPYEEHGKCRGPPRDPQTLLGRMSTLFSHFVLARVGFSGVLPSHALSPRTVSLAFSKV